MTTTSRISAGASVIAAAILAHPALAADLPTIGGIVFQQDQYFRGSSSGCRRAPRITRPCCRAIPSRRPRRRPRW